MIILYDVIVELNTSSICI